MGITKAWHPDALVYVTFGVAGDAFFPELIKLVLIRKVVPRAMVRILVPFPLARTMGSWWLVPITMPYSSARRGERFEWETVKK